MTQKSQTYDFSDRFLKLFGFSQKLLSQIRGFSLLEKKNRLWEALLHKWLRLIFFYTKSYDPPKSQIFDFFTVFSKLIDFSQILSSQIWDFGFIW